MSRSEMHPQTPRKGLTARLGPAASMFAATLLSLPANAGITLPTDPLTTASRVAPNILFILDDSGSMAFNYMPDSVPNTSAPDVSDQAYTRNTLYYNPSITYQPWTSANGTLMTGGTSYNAVYGGFNYASGTTINLASSSSCARYDYNNNGVDGESGDTQVCGGTQTFYVPKNLANVTSAYLGAGTNYYRYQIINGSYVERSEWGNVVTSNTTNVAVVPATGSVNNNTANHLLASVSAGRVLDVVITSSNNRSKDYSVRDPSNNEVCSGSVNNTQSNTCTINPTVSGVYKVVMSRNTNNNGTYSISASSYTTNGCSDTSGSTGWINCTNATPTGRTVANELTNYATWFSYHRSRMKAAKAGSSAAFSEIGGDVRVGFRTIWRRDAGSTPGNRPTYNVPIPVNYNDGLFSDSTVSGTLYDNRSQWYTRLFSTYGNSGTPLHGALQSAGEYYRSTAANGPYGPTTGADQLACRQNFAILTTDGYYNNSSNYSGGIGNADGTDGSTITGPGGQSYTYTAAPPYSDAYGSTQLSGSNYADATLADVAMRYWKNDLRSDMDNIVPTTSSNPAFWQHMVTFGIAIGLSGTTDQSSVAEVLANGNASVGGVAGWPRPVGDQNTTIDDLMHASVNGHGTFVSAGDPMAFTNGLKAALAAITERTGSFSNVAANSASLNTGAKLFQANYVSGVWTGEVMAFAKNATNNNFSTTPSWRASQGIPTTGRKVFTSNSGVGSNFPTTAQVTALNRTGQYAVTGADNAAYIAGNRTLELQNGGTLRNRNHLFGDIVSSSPFYVKDTDTLYVGANDGMLHAINAANGNELFAFVPNGIDLGQLGTISRPDYAHRYFVDGPIVVSTRTQTPGSNILVGGLGKGGKGLFALNVTNPATVNAAGALRWERLDTPNGNMGLIQSKPLIVKLNGGVTGLVVANGINSTTGHAALLVYNLSTGELIKEIDTGVGSNVTDSANSNGLTGAVGWDRDGNGTTDAIYGGDMLGNVWKFDLSSSSSGSWGVANSGSPLFVAVGPDGITRQPITGGPTLALHPSTYKTWVFFGTGRFITTGDVNNSAVQSLYGFIDQGSTVAKSDLTQRSVVVVSTSDGKKVRSFEQNAALPTNSKGWYINLLEPPSPGTAVGERIVTPPQMDGSVLEVSSIIPTADACQSDGRGYLNAVDAFTGTSTSKPYFDVNGDGDFTNDVLPLPSNGGEAPIGSVDLGVGMVTQGTLFSGGSGGTGSICAAGSAGSLGCVGKNEVRNVGRVSWREVIRN